MSAPATQRLLTARRWVLLAGAFALPLAYAPVVYDAYVLPKLLLAWLLVLVLLGLQVADWVLQRRVAIRRTPVDIPLLGLVLSAGLSTGFAVNQNVALFGTYLRFEGLLTIATYALLFWLACQTVSTPADAVRLTRTVLASCYAVALLGILQSVVGTAATGGHAGESATSFAGITRPGSTLGNANALGILLAMMLPLALHEIITTRSTAGRIIAANVSGVFGLALLLTFSRSAWLGALTGVVVVVLAATPHARRVAIRVGVVALIAGAVIVAVGHAGSGGVVHAVAARVESLASPTGGSGASRIGIWRDSAAVVQARPLVGWGPDTFGLVLPRYQSGNWTPGVPIDETHSALLQVAVTQGVVGVIFFVWLIGAFVVTYLRSRAHRGAAALFGAWLAYEVAVELNFSWLPITLPFWFVAAAAIAVWHPTPTTERVAAEGLGRLRVAAAAMVCLGALAAAAIATSRPLLADMYFYAGLADQQRGQFLAARIETSRAQSLAPWQSVYAVRAGDQALAVRVGDAPGRGADLDAALADYEEASRLGTSQPAAYRRLAITAAALGRRNEAIAAAREAVSLGPFDSTNRVLLTEILQAR